jgi:hypothetical protein
VAGDGDCAGSFVEVDPPLAGAIGGVQVQGASQADGIGLAQEAGQELGQELFDARGGDVSVERRRQRLGA